MISFRKLNVIFNQGTAMENHAIRGLDLDINEGEFITVIGSNGAGKSTLLKSLTGEVQPQGGKVLVDSVDITNWSTTRRAPWVAHVFQDPMIGTCGDLTIEENLALAYRRGQSRAWKARHCLYWAITPSYKEMFREYVSMLGLGLESRLGDQIGRLSGGQRQALSLVMAAISPMKILVLDEHTAALDPKMADLVMNLTKKIVADRNLTVMMVTHSMHQALDSGSRTIMLHQGKVMFDITGEQRENLDVHGLLDLFQKHTGTEVDDDKLVLN
ncbi:MAG: ABC transporter ATP-binding protein [Alphaproteobacteria bacterium]